MGVVTYVKGAVIYFDHSKYELDHEMELGKWLLRDLSTGHTKIMQLVEMQSRYAKGELVFKNDTHDAISSPLSTDRWRFPAVIQPAYSEKDMEVAKVKRMYVQEVLNLPKTKVIFEAAIRNVWEKIREPESPPHWITVYRWKEKFINGGMDISSLINKAGQKGRWSRYPNGVMEIVREAIDIHFLSRTPKSIEDTLNMAIVKVDIENSQRPTTMHLPRPTRRLVKRLIDKISAFEKYASHHGMVAAKSKFRQTLYHHVSEAPLERVEVDHTPLDLFVLRDEDFVPLGRPYLTVCVDGHSKCILGIYIGFEPPSYLSVSRCLRHAILPKNNLREIYPEIKNEWPAHGIPVLVILDNGMEFHSQSFENACLSLNIQAKHCKPREPWLKGMVERFQGTLNRSIAHIVPGTTFSNIFQKGDYDPVKHAVLTLSDLRLVVHKWIADVYHQKPHRSLGGATPAATWNSSINPRDIRIADDPRRLDVILGTSDQRQLTGKGISKHGLSYNSPELQTVFRQFAVNGKGINVDIRIDEGDLGQIYVIAPDRSGYALPVPALDQGYAKGTSLWMHKVFKRYAKENALPDNTTGWREASMRIAEIVQHHLNTRPRKSHAKAARYLEARKGMADEQVVSDANALQDLSAAATDSTVEVGAQVPARVRTRKTRDYTAIIEDRG